MRKETRDMVQHFEELKRKAEDQPGNLGVEVHAKTKMHKWKRLGMDPARVRPAGVEASRLGKCCPGDTDRGGALIVNEFLNLVRSRSLHLG